MSLWEDVVRDNSYIECTANWIHRIPSYSLWDSCNSSTSVILGCFCFVSPQSFLHCLIQGPSPSLSLPLFLTSPAIDNDERFVVKKKNWTLHLYTFLTPFDFFVLACCDMFGCFVFLQTRQSNNDWDTSELSISGYNWFFR